MTIKPILFTGQMVRAILEGRKSQTRRVITRGLEKNAKDKWHCFNSGGGSLGVPENEIPNVMPDYLPIETGCLLWVRENHYLTDNGHDETVVYATDDDAVEEHKVEISSYKRQLGLSDEWENSHLRLRPSIHMPKWASRLTLEVTDVRVQRLQDISEEDAVAEGCAAGEKLDEISGVAEGWSAKSDFRGLWDSINGAEGPNSWEGNPWIAAYSFRVHRMNVDEVDHV